MKKIVEYKAADGTCEVGDVVYLRSALREKAILIDIEKSKYCELYIFKPLADRTIFFTDKDGAIPFNGKPYIFAKEVEVKEEQP